MLGFTEQTNPPSPTKQRPFSSTSSSYSYAESTTSRTAHKKGIKRVAVIGAGASGLVALKECLAQGCFDQVICFEQNQDIGGLWRYSPSLPSDHADPSPVYQSAVINTSKQMLGYSDFPVPNDWPTFLPHDRVRQYLGMYAEHFGLKRHIKLGRQVISILPVMSRSVEEDTANHHTGEWQITYQKISSSSSPKTEVFQHVIVANGHHWKPKPPSFPGLEDFQGTKLHSHRYRMPYAFKDQSVLIIGAGNSGLDISSELSHHASKVFLSTRTGAWVFPRATLFGLPTDFLNSRAFSSLPRSVMNIALESLISLSSGALPSYGLNPRHRVLQAAPAINSEIFHRISAGKVVVKPNVDRFLEHSVIFQDKSIQEIDTVIYCTGYAIEHAFLDRHVLGQEKDGDRPQLYKHVFSMAYKNIAFVGLVQPFGSILPVAELQSRWIVQVFSGSQSLPQPNAMRDAVDMEWVNHNRLYLPRERHILQVDYVTYLDELATLIGCMPDLWSLWRSNWTLAAQVTFGPALPQHYRLSGPGSDAKRAQDFISAVCAGGGWGGG